MPEIWEQAAATNACADAVHDDISGCSTCPRWLAFLVQNRKRGRITFWMLLSS
jgi:hypothetical protein